MSTRELTSEELNRYARHLVLPAVGVVGQCKIKNAKVLVVGAGGLGSPALLYLAASGIGTLGIVEDDYIDLSNLQRQVLYDSTSVGSAKITLAAKRVNELNPHVSVVAHGTRLTLDIARSLIAQYDVILDGSDNFPTRYLINDACFFEQKPLVSAAIMGFEGQLAVFGYRHGPCYRCLFPSPPPPELAPNCAEAGVLGVLPGVLGTLQATEVLKIILGIGEPLSGKLLHYDALAMEFRTFSVPKADSCPLCGKSPTITTLKLEAEACQTEIQIQELEPRELALRLEDFTVVDVREDFERAICSIKGSVHLPLSNLAQSYPSLGTAKPIIFFCKSGARSKRAALMLNDFGIKSCSMKGGILQWITDVEPALSKY